MTTDSPAAINLNPAENYPPYQHVANTISETATREFYDPAGRFNDMLTDVFFRQVATSRAEAFIPRLGLLRGSEVILAEASHCLLDDGRGVALPVAEDRQRHIVAAVRDGANLSAQTIHQTAADYRAEHEAIAQKFPKTKFNSLPNETILGAKILAAVAHAGIERRNHREYFTHPEDVASIHRIAWKDLRYPFDDPDYTNVQVICYLHDAPEDTIDAFGSYIGAPIPVTPLVASAVLKRTIARDAYDVAKSLYYMMRVRDVDGQRMPYAAYNDRLVRQPGNLGRRCLIAKTADRTHNLSIEPDEPGIDIAKQRKVLRKKADYELAQSRSINDADIHGPRVVRLIEVMQQVTKAEVSEESRNNAKFSVRDIAAQAHSRALANIALYEAA